MTRSPSRSSGTPPSPRFDLAALRKAAGEKAYGRGEEYHRGGQVEIIAVDAKRVAARVLGSELYRTQLIGKGRNFSGECSCPAFSDWGFCKHMVATALAANAGGAEAADAAKGRLARISDHLRAQGIEALIERLMAMGEHDPALFAELELAAAMDQADDAALLKQFKKAIADVTRTSDLIDYREVRAWAEAVGGALRRIGELVERRRAPLVLQILDVFFAEMSAAMGDIDDSNGHAGGVLAQAAEMHLEACRIAKPDPIALARELFGREMSDVSDVFFRASAVYADLLGPTGLAEYRRLAEAAWAKIKPRRAERIPAETHDSGDRFRLQTILQDMAEQRGDVDAIIALHTKDLSAPHRYLQLAELCREHGRDADALRWAEEGLWQFEKDPDERLVAFAADLYRRGGRRDEAEKLLWPCFEHRPSLELFAKLKKLARSGKGGEAAERAIALLRTRSAAQPRSSGPYAWLSGSSHDLLLQVLIREKRLAEGWEIAANRPCFPKTLEELARASEEAHPIESVNAYARLVENALSGTGKDAYEEARRIVARMRSLRERRGEAAAHASYVDDLLRHHKAKRNFVKLMRNEAAHA